MNLPASVINQFQEAVESVFYDKDVSIYQLNTDVDSEGFAHRGEPTLIGAVKGNTYTDLANTREDFGIEEEVDLIVSTQELIDPQSLLKVAGFDGYFRIVKMLTRDTHYLLACKAWSSTLSD